MATKRPTKRQLCVEHLEDRCVPTLFGTAWPDPGHLTLSFVPDGTPADNSASGLSGLLASQGLNSTAAQTEILRAFQTWAVNANINIGLQTDGGQPVGTPGALEGDARFGDIRVGAEPLGTQAGIGTPYNLVTGTRAGDVLLNTLANYGIGGSAGSDLYSVLLHEAGHVLGLQDNADPASVMYDYYAGVRTGLSAGDVAALQALYGTRSPDAFEGATGNDTLATATNLNLPFGNNTLLPLQADADVSSLQDADVYKFNVPWNSTQFTVRARNQGISLLEPRLTVYDASGNVVATTVSTSPLTGSIIIQVQSAVPGATYYAKVQSGSQDVFGVGGYRVKVFFSSYDPTLSPITLPALTDSHNNDTLNSATTLIRLPLLNSMRFDYTVRGTLEDATDVDYYRVQAPAATNPVQNVMLVELWGLDSNPVAAKASLYDQYGNPISANVLTNDHGTYVAQITNAVPGATYYVAVSSPSTTSNTGTYFLGVDYRSDAVTPTTLTTASLSAGSTQGFGTLRIQEGAVYHLDLVTSTSNASVAAGVRMTVYDANYNPVFTTAVAAGSTVSANLYLQAGTYYLRFAAGTANGAALPALTAVLRGDQASDPLSPMPVDTMTDPVTTSPPPPTSTSPTVTTDPTTTYTPIASTDPYSNPYDPTLGMMSL